MSSGFKIGVDGGGTKTECVLIDASGAIIARLAWSQDEAEENNMVFGRRQSFVPRFVETRGHDLLSENERIIILDMRRVQSVDVTATHMPWHTPRKSGRDCSSPIVIGNYIIVTSLDGIATCYDAVDGHQLWKERLAGKFSASPIAAGGLAYYLNENGKTFVIEPGEELKIVAENDIPAGKDEIFRASLTPSLGQLFVRSNSVLYCVGKK